MTLTPLRLTLPALCLGLFGCAGHPPGERQITFYDSASQLPAACRMLGPVSAASPDLRFIPSRFVEAELTGNARQRYGTLTDTVLMLSATSALVGNVLATGQAYSCNIHPR